MHPDNTYWKKIYNLYSKIDTEADRFLDFEKWWGSPVLLTAGEMQSIADDLFVGNKLAPGELRTSTGIRVDLRNIQSPIIVFCSWGDDITPPQQALGWILDLYDHEDEIVAAGQTIVYCLHQSIGHLGIFVSGKVATKEHGEFAQAMDLIDVMPPGLYEAVITGVDETVDHPELVTRRLSVQVGEAHAGRDPGFGRQQPRGRAALCRGGQGFRNQQGPVPDLCRSDGPYGGNRAERRRAARPAPEPVALSNVRRRQSADEAGRRLGRAGARQPPPGRRRQPVSGRRADDRRTGSPAGSKPGARRATALWRRFF